MQRLGAVVGVLGMMAAMSVAQTTPSVAQTTADASWETLLERAQQAYERFDNVQAVTYYEQAYRRAPDRPQILFGLVRACINVGEDLEDQKKDSSAQKAYERALTYAREGIQKFPESAEAHLLFATALGQIALLSGGKKQVQLSQDVKEHLDRALALDPHSAEAHAAIGIYHREVSQINWFLRKFAVHLFGGLPKASMEEALQHLDRAVQLRPDWIFAHLELGKTLWALDQKERAREEWRKVLELPRQDHRDPVYREEARKLLEKNK